MTLVRRPPDKATRKPPLQKNGKPAGMAPDVDRASPMNRQPAGTPRQPPHPGGPLPRFKRLLGRRTGLRGLVALAALVGGALALVASIAIALLATYTRDLPSPDALAARHQFQTARILDRNGELLYEIAHPQKGRRTVVPLERIPMHLRQAVLAAEDARFYDTPGVDLRGILRALWRNLRAWRVVEGGSTITQQLVKISLLSNERTLERKVREAVLALEVERRYSKDQILEMYLNNVYFGQQAYGVAAAAQVYFGKPVERLSLGEAALLAGLIRAPSVTNPFKDIEAARAEQARVLEAMVRSRFISPEQAQEARQEPLNLRPLEEGIPKAPHFSLWVRDLIKADPRLGEAALYERGLRITTTLDLRMQEMAELIVRNHLQRLETLNARNAALVAINPATGEVLALVGSAGFQNKEIQGEINMALAPRQPGSSIKPFTYLAAFMKGWTAATILNDEPAEFAQSGQPPYRPRNYDGRFHGPVSIRMALANSYNIPAVKTLEFVGVPELIALTKRLGIATLEDPSRYGLSLTLGGGEVKLLELTAAYGVLANGGKRVEPFAISKIEDAQGNVLFQAKPLEPRQVVPPGYAYLITSILSDNDARTPAFGPRSPLLLSRPAAVKTGTTDDFKDNWTIGYTSQLVAGVWVGNADNTPMRGATGVTGAAPIWHDFMEFALAPLPVDELQPPPEVERVPVAWPSGRRWQEGCPEGKFEEWFVRGTAPKEVCTAPTPTPTPVPTATPIPTLTPLPTLTPRATSTSVTDSGAASQARATPVASPTAMQSGRAALGEMPAARIAIVSPQAGSSVSGDVPVVGSAVVPEFRRYTLEYARITRERELRWVRIGEPVTQPVTDGRLAVWQTSGLPSGDYLLRLTVEGASERREATVQVRVG